MEWLHIIILALIQGITEFLPISSSAHLVFPSLLFGWPDQGLAFDVAVHIGSLSAVVFYLRKDIARLWLAWCASVKNKTADTDGRIAWGLLVATLPAGIVGFFIEDIVELYLRSLWVIASTTLLFALLLAWADRRPKLNIVMGETTWKSILLIGCAQVFALVPGTSRSGVTMTAGLMLGLTREAAAKISFLLSIPLIAAIGLYKAIELLSSDMTIVWSEILLGVSISAVVAFLCIRWFVNFVNTVGFMPFVIYRIILSVGLFWMYIQFSSV